MSVLAERAKDRFTFVGVSLSSEGIAAFDKTLPFPVYAVRDSNDPIWRQYEVGVTPSVVVISADSRIEKRWIGAIRNKTKEAMEQYFGVQLPALEEGD